MLAMPLSRSLTSNSFFLYSAINVIIAPTNVPSFSKITRDKIEHTMIDRYGVRHQMQDDQIKQKIADTNLERYDATNVFAIPTVKQRIRETMIERYGAANPSQVMILQAKKLETSQLNRSALTILGSILRSRKRSNRPILNATAKCSLIDRRR